MLMWLFLGDLFDCVFDRFEKVLECFGGRFEEGFQALPVASAFVIECFPGSFYIAGKPGGWIDGYQVQGDGDLSLRAHSRGDATAYPALQILWLSKIILVGAKGFEPSTPWSRKPYGH